ncbi:MAG: ATP-dependent RecD-like DNA helicase [Firmicutes bacterium HGW-Firmicutes-21]|nr:MAG: ATP-dependent RecD-like DNA helicase [Firmicutes bacterium HGW-Firmicutes-21]
MTEIVLDGVIEEIIFSNEENGYTVCVINAMGEPVTLVGIMPFINEGETIRVQGAWQVHATFGRQFRVEYFEKKLPTTSGTILKYLSSGAIKGVGPVTAERIVSRYGEDSLDVIENNPEWLSDIKGITLKKAHEISEVYRMQFGMRTVMLYCNRFFGPSLSVKIFKRYGSAAIDTIENNPYILCEDIAGIGFEKADKVAMDLNFAYNCPERIEAGVIHYLSAAAYNGGHCYLPEEKLIETIMSALQIGREEISAAIRDLVFTDKLVRSEINGGSIIFLKEYFDAEKYIAAKLVSLSEEEFPFVLDGIGEQLSLLEERYELEYANEQKRAVNLAVTKGVTIVTGGPGTGKTTVIKAIIDIFKSLKYSFMLAAPTGRAAKRMSEASGCEAKTIHRLLEMNFNGENTPRFARDEVNPLPYKAIIIDEMSMVDTLLMESLLKAVKSGSYLILIGDVDQLPPVGAGNCLSDIINSGRFEVCTLTKIFRQAQESMIIVNAHSINDGIMPRLDIKDSDFFFIKRENSAEIRDMIVDLTVNRLPRKYKINFLDDIQIITPTKKGELGTVELNRMLQNSLNPQTGRKKEKKHRNIIFRESDKVMQTRNNYDLEWIIVNEEYARDNENTGQGIFNGDIGRIISIDTQSEVMVIDFDKRITEYDFSLLDELEHAYAITVHKSQGSEYKIVLFPAYESPLPLMSRNLLYTAVTRAKEMVCIVGKSGCIETMVKNNRRPVRHTALGEFLCRL